MRHRVIYVLIGVLTLSVGALYLLLSRSRDTPGDTWGLGRLKVSERAYSTRRVKAIFDTLGQIGWQIERGSVPPTERIPFLCLVVDATKREMWIESDGQVLPEYHTALPPTMDWRLCRPTPKGTAELPPLCRFRAERTCSGPVWPENILLMGTRGRREELEFMFSPTGGGVGGYSRGLWVGRSQAYATAPPAASDKSHESFLLSEADYEKAKAQFDPSGPVPADWVVFRENRAAWVRVEKRLCQEIERQMNASGRDLSSLDLRCGPDYTGASADVTAGHLGRLGVFRGGSDWAQVRLKIDWLGGDVWYVKSEPRLRSPKTTHLDLEFLVWAAEKLPEPGHAAWLQAGRTRQQEIAHPPLSKWQVNLPNGVTFEFLGICQNPSAGRLWWGPDGSPLDHAPHVNHEPGRSRFKDRPIYEIVWRIRRPRPSEVSLRGVVEGLRDACPFEVWDHYGNRMEEELRTQGYVFDKGQTSTNLKVVAKNGSGESVLATFKNITLVPGQNQGFEIEAAK